MESVGLAAEPFDGHPGSVAAAGRMYVRLTALVRNGRLRAKLPTALRIYGPGVSEAMARVLDDPRFAPAPGRPAGVAAALLLARYGVDPSTQAVGPPTPSADASVDCSYTARRSEVV